MAIIQIALTDEKGRIINEVKGSTYLIGQFLPDMNDDRSQCLRYIDSYGDTIFNRIQMEQFIKEWQEILGHVKTNEEREVMRDVLGLAEECQKCPHTFLRFYGD